MAKRALVVHIDSLVLEGVPAAQAGAFAEALRAEIQRNLQHSGAFEALGARPSVEQVVADAATTVSLATPARFGREAGSVVHRTLVRGSSPVLASASTPRESEAVSKRPTVGSTFIPRRGT